MIIAGGRIALGYQQWISTTGQDINFLKAEVTFIGNVVIELFALLGRPALLRARETASQFETACVDAIPIIALVNFLIGVVVAYVLGVEAQG